MAVATVSRSISNLLFRFFFLSVAGSCLGYELIKVGKLALEEVERYIFPRSVTETVKKKKLTS